MLSSQRQDNMWFLSSTVHRYRRKRWGRVYNEHSWCECPIICPRHLLSWTLSSLPNAICFEVHSAFNKIVFPEIFSSLVAVCSFWTSAKCGLLHFYKKAVNGCTLLTSRSHVENHSITLTCIGEILGEVFALSGNSNQKNEIPLSCRFLRAKAVGWWMPTSGHSVADSSQYSIL